MPILPAEPALYPDDLLRDSNEIELQDRQWYVTHTRPQQEKCLTRELRRLGIPYYLPLLSRRRRFRRRVMTSHVPLFQGYVSVFASGDERVNALATRRVVRVLDVPDQDRFLVDLRQIERLLSSDAPVTLEDRLAPGDQVKIRSGPLAGLEGKVLRTDHGRRFLVTVDFMQRGASIVADDFDLEAVR